MNINELSVYLNSDEGKRAMDEYTQKILRESECIDRWVEKFKSKYEDKLDCALERLMDKYYSDEYVNREYKIGVQPREPLLWLVWEYAMEHCEQCEDEKYLNDFTGDAYYIGSYVIQIMYGQGAILKIDKRY